MNPCCWPHYASFDLSVLRSVLTRHAIPYPDLDYICTWVLARTAWPGLLSYTLPVVTESLDIEFEHHDPLEDARASAEIALRACRESGLTHPDDLPKAYGFRAGWLFEGGYKPCSVATDSTGRKLDARDISPTASDFDEAHPLFGRTVAFTGTLEQFLRKEAMQHVVDAGGFVANGVSKNIDYLVVGELDYRAVIAGTASTKLLKARQLAEKGYPIEIIPESQFLRFLH